MSWDDKAMKQLSEERTGLSVGPKSRSPHPAVLGGAESPQSTGDLNGFTEWGHVAGVRAPEHRVVRRLRVRVTAEVG